MQLHSAAVVFDESELTGEVSSRGSVSKYMVAFLVRGRHGEADLRIRS